MVMSRYNYSLTNDADGIANGMLFLSHGKWSQSCRNADEVS